MIYVKKNIGAEGGAGSLNYSISNLLKHMKNYKDKKIGLANKMIKRSNLLWSLNTRLIMELTRHDK